MSSLETNEPMSTSICLACGDALSPALVRSASLRCHDCRDVAAPIHADLVERMPAPLRRRAERLDLVTRDDQIRVVVAALGTRGLYGHAPGTVPGTGLE